MKSWLLVLIVAVASFLSSCSKDSAPFKTGAFPEIPRGFPEMVFPADNEYSLDRWNLGKRLFYETRLSKDGKVSCASCHKPELAFADNLATSPGSEDQPGTRNSPSLSNIGYHPYFTREGGVPTLEMQILVPIQEHNEFNHNIVAIAQELAMDSSYQESSRLAYGRNMEPFVITRALANFERSLISGNSKYDQYEFWKHRSALNTSELRGKNLFFSSRTNCSKCHSGFNFTNYRFENNGLYEIYLDPGRKRFTGLDTDQARFKVPSLRNVSYTAPYMHDGSIQSLEEVIEHYNSGGVDHKNKNSMVKPLHLSVQEKADLLAFLHCLSDADFVSNELFK